MTRPTVLLAGYRPAVADPLPPSAGLPPQPRAAGSPPGTVELVRAAAGGDQSAWDELVRRYAALVWSVARAHRLDATDAADVSQTTWLRLVEHLGRLREPEHLGGWLVTTARRECLRVLARTGRELPDDTAGVDRAGPAEDSPEGHLLTDERRRLLWQALQLLPPRCQTLLRTLAGSPDASYADVSAALGMPVGSIGPTRMRCLDQLRRHLAAPEMAEGVGS